MSFSCPATGLLRTSAIEIILSTELFDKLVFFCGIIPPIRRESAVAEFPTYEILAFSKFALLWACADEPESDEKYSHEKWITTAKMSVKIIVFLIKFLISGVKAILCKHIF